MFRLYAQAWVFSCPSRASCMTTSHLCLHAPGSHVETDATGWQTRSCRFRDLCFEPREVNTTSHGFQYLVGADQGAERLHPKQMELSLKPLGRPGTKPWLPRFVQASELSTGKYANALRIRGPVVLLGEYNNENPGHFFMDALLPIFAMLDLFGRSKFAGDVLPLRIKSDDSPWNCDWHATTSRANARRRYAFLGTNVSESVWTTYRATKLANCERIITTFSSLLTRRPFMRPSIASAPVGLTCFDEAYAGAGMLSDHSLGRVQAWPNRCALWWTLQRWQTPTPVAL